MLHFFQHRYKDNNYNFIWDIESGSLHSVDGVAFLCAKDKYGVLTDAERESYKEISVETRNEVFAELDELEKEGLLNYPCQSVFKKKNSHIVKSICLNICHDCNMRCIYCFAGGGNYHSERGLMSLETGKKAVDFLIENSGPRKHLEIDFFGGEPLMNLDVIKGVVTYAREREKETGKVFSFTVTTNCILLDKETIDYFNETMDNIVISIDGRKCTHDGARRPLDEKHTYETIIKNALDVKKSRAGKSYYVRGTFTAKNLDFSKDILALNDLGFDQISVEPVVLPESSPIAIKEEHIPAIKAEYEKFANEYLDRRMKDKKSINFFHFVVDLEDGPCIHKRMTGCGAGTEYLSIIPSGEIYPCHQYVGEKDFLLGSLDEGIKRADIREKFAETSIETKEKCLECFAKYYCGGGCMANAHKLGENGIYGIGCELTKKRFELSLAVAGIEREA